MKEGQEVVHAKMKPKGNRNKMKASGREGCAQLHSGAILIGSPGTSSSSWAFFCDSGPPGPIIAAHSVAAASALWGVLPSSWASTTPRSFALPSADIAARECCSRVGRYSLWEVSHTSPRGNAQLGGTVY